MFIEHLFMKYKKLYNSNPDKSIYVEEAERSEDIYFPTSYSVLLTMFKHQSATQITLSDKTYLTPNHTLIYDVVFYYEMHPDLAVLDMAKYRQLSWDKFETAMVDIRKVQPAWEPMITTCDPVIDLVGREYAGLEKEDAEFIYSNFLSGLRCIDCMMSLDRSVRRSYHVEEYGVMAFDYFTASHERSGLLCRDHNAKVYFHMRDGTMDAASLKVLRETTSQLIKAHAYSAFYMALLYFLDTDNSYIGDAIYMFSVGREDMELVHKDGDQEDKRMLLHYYTEHLRILDYCKDYDMFKTPNRKKLYREELEIACRRYSELRKEVATPYVLSNTIYTEKQSERTMFVKCCTKRLAELT
jgi:hypothetical protein